MVGSPQKIASGLTEDHEQMALFVWVSMAAFAGINVANDERAYTISGWAVDNMNTPRPELLSMFAIPNGGERNVIVATKLKATGVKKGVSDIMFPLARHGMHGLFLEMKKAKGGKESPEQAKFGAAVLANGYGYCVCHGWEAARAILIEYLAP